MNDTGAFGWGRGIRLLPQFYLYHWYFQRIYLNAENINHTLKQTGETVLMRKDETMKKWLALSLAGAMLCSIPVMAAESPSARAVVIETVDNGMGGTAQSAAEAGKTVGEYMNNAVVTVNGLEDVLPIGQGGHVIVNGAPSNYIFWLNKPKSEEVSVAKVKAAEVEGKILSLVSTSSEVKGFTTAEVNFYLKGVKDGQKILVYLLVDGGWSELEVTEIREDHVVVKMPNHGTLMFVEVPDTAALTSQPVTQ